MHPKFQTLKMECQTNVYYTVAKVKSFYFYNFT